MTTTKVRTSRRLLFVLAALCLVAALATPVLANTRYTDGGELPIYARGLDNSEWAFFVFYRPPACVPPDFNLLDMFDVPRVFDCDPPTTEGFVIVEEGAEAPIQQNLHGLGAVPVWFMSSAELWEALDDGILTMLELAEMPSLLVGTATFYQETLHPIEAAQVAKFELVGKGVLEDGREFRIKASLQEKSMVPPNVQIVFR